MNEVKERSIVAHRTKSIIGHCVYTSFGWVVHYRSHTGDQLTTYAEKVSEFKRNWRQATELEVSEYYAKIKTFREESE